MRTQMKRMMALLLAVLLCTAAAGAETAYPAGNPEEVAAVIVHTNDVHVSLDENIGYDGLALYLKELRADYDHVLLIDAGDAIQGGPIGVISKGADIIKIMNKLGYDLAVPGNHEFDFGFDVLDDCAEQLNCGYTCANFCTADEKPVFAPWRMLTAGELKIAFIGAVAPDTFTKTSIKDILNEVGEPMYDFLADDTGERLAQALQGYIDEARAEGADYVILVSHLGNNDSITERFRTEKIMERLEGLDAIIDGHSHEIYNKTVTDRTGKEIPVAQAGNNMKRIGQLTIYRDGRLEEKIIETVPEAAGIPAETVTRGNRERLVDPEMKAFVEEIYASRADVMEEKIGTLPFDLIVRDADGYDISRVTENPLCNLVADAYRACGGTQIALVNAGSVRNNLEAGEITYKSIMSILPYPSEVVTAKITGQMLLDALEFGVSNLPSVSAGFLQVSGITCRVNAGMDSHVVRDDKNRFLSVDGEYRVSDVTVNGEPLDPDAEYTMTTSSFLLNGGDGYSMFKEADLLTNTMVTDSQMMVQYIRDLPGGVIPDTYRAAEGRMIME